MSRASVAYVLLAQLDSGAGRSYLAPRRRRERPGERRPGDAVEPSHRRRQRRFRDAEQGR
jgi:hypothetical protein